MALNIGMPMLKAKSSRNNSACAHACDWIQLTTALECNAHTGLFIWIRLHTNFHFNWFGFCANAGNYILSGEPRALSKFWMAVASGADISHKWIKLVINLTLCKEHLQEEFRISLRPIRYNNGRSMRDSAYEYTWFRPRVMAKWNSTLLSARGNLLRLVINHSRFILFIIYFYKYRLLYLHLMSLL